MSAKRERIINKQGAVPSFWVWDVTFALLIFAFVSGVRYNVGVDHLAYLNNYLTVQNSDHLVFDKEWGFDAVTVFFANLGIHFSLYFGFLAFLQIFFFYRTFKCERYLYPFLGVIIIFGPEYLNWMNGIRQMLVATMFVYAIQFIVKKNWRAYFVIIALATLIHQSAVLLFLIYFIPQRDFFKNRVITTILVFCSLLLGQTNFWIQIVDSLSGLINLIGYGKIFSRLDTLIADEQIRALGPRKVSIVLLAILTIFFSGKLKLYFKESNFLIYYNLAIVGLLLSNLLSNAHHIFLRPVTYLVIFSVVTTAYLVVYLQKTSRKNILWLLATLLLAVCYLPISIIADYGKGDSDYSSYKFYWYHN
ncbi:EpsG family protein [Cycloclasticus pugetii]|uniref:EpsG family protein n=1 Tax=Cycloclasticus pugetii TaxID=34068 RepID=UPI003A94CC88